LRDDEARILTYIEDRARDVMLRYNVGEIRIPLLERIELYQRSSGETSDIVEKQMYTFRESEDGNELAFALRPEGTPGVVRAYIEAGLDRREPEQRLYYSGPMFRRERPQKGRFRQFHQFGVEIFGRADAACDAELMMMIADLAAEFAVKLKFEINSLGDPQCRGAFRDALLAYGRAHWDELCDDCHNRLERNPLRLLDCKIDTKLAESAPKSTDYLCAECRAHFEALQKMLAAGAVPFEVNPRLVRGLDYYTRTTFEVTTSGLGSQNAVAAGGRYDGLVEALGGSSVAGTGFAIGLERMALAARAARDSIEAATEAPIAPTAIGDDLRPPLILLTPLGDQAALAAVAIARELRGELHGSTDSTPPAASTSRHEQAAWAVELVSPNRSLKSALKRADKLRARFAVIIGENELARGIAQVRDLQHAEQAGQTEVRLADVARAIRGGKIADYSVG
jgi:histidyl-tRNA synthetase